VASNSETDDRIEKYLVSAVEAIGALTEKRLIGHALIIIYSTIDTIGLLDAPTSQVSASGDSFKNWVKKYLLCQPKVEFNEIDLWGARCAVLHTFTSRSDLSNAGHARELQYYFGDSTSPGGIGFAQAVRRVERGRHVPVNFLDFTKAFFLAAVSFGFHLVRLALGKWPPRIE
jgi:hypothetical protein